MQLNSIHQNSIRQNKNGPEAHSHACSLPRCPLTRGSSFCSRDQKGPTRGPYNIPDNLPDKSRNWPSTQRRRILRKGIGGVKARFLEDFSYQMSLAGLFVYASAQALIDHATLHRGPNRPQLRKKAQLQYLGEIPNAARPTRAAFVTNDAFNRFHMAKAPELKLVI